MHLADQYYRLVATAYPKAQSESLRHYELDARLKFLGHSMEIITYGRTFGLFTPTAAQQAEIRRATETLVETILDISTLDLGAVRDQTRPLYHLLVGDACHAYHGLWMARGVNQV